VGIQAAAAPHDDFFTLAPSRTSRSLLHSLRHPMMHNAACNLSLTIDACSLAFLSFSQRDQLSADPSHVHFGARLPLIPSSSSVPARPSVFAMIGLINWLLVRHEQLPWRF